MEDVINQDNVINLGSWTEQRRAKPEAQRARQEADAQQRELEQWQRLLLREFRL